MTMLAPPDQATVADAIRGAHESRAPIFPCGGRTSCDSFPGSNAAGQELDLTGLSRIVDYTPRDMTIVVEAGVRMADLAATLAAERQQLPIDVPCVTEATLGGVVATNWSGPRRLGYGTMRDYVIGIHAVDGRGVAFKGGGRVVKNVAGYDFCKLLTGSFGTLGVITQVALKVKPLAECQATIVAAASDLAAAETILGRLANLAATPTALDLLLGDAWNDVVPGGDASGGTFAVRVEGSEAEIHSLAEQVQYEFWQGGASGVQQLPPASAAALWTRQVEFADRGAAAEPDDAALVIKVAVPPSALLATIEDLRSASPKLYNSSACRQRHPRWLGLQSFQPPT